MHRLLSMLDAYRYSALQSRRDLCVFFDTFLLTTPRLYIAWVFEFLPITCKNMPSRKTSARLLEWLCISGQALLASCVCFLCGILIIFIAFVLLFVQALAYKLCFL